MAKRNQAVSLLSRPSRAAARLCLFAALAVVLGSPPAAAQFTGSTTWQQGNSNQSNRQLYGRNNNWTGNAPNSANVQAFFAATGQTAINVNGNYATGRLTFNSDAQVYSFSNNSLILGNAGDTAGLSSSALGILHQANNAQTFNTALNLATSQTWRISSTSGNLTFTGAIGLGAHTLYFDPANSGNTITVDGVMSGTGGITMGGAGLLVLGGANTYTEPPPSTPAPPASPVTTASAPPVPW